MGRRWALAVAATVVVLAVAQQVVLPPLAERRLRSELAASGEVERLDVRALPALELLWRRADSVSVTMREYRMRRTRLADMLADSRGVRRLDARAATLRADRLVMHAARMRKSGDALEGEASVTATALRAAMPPNLAVRPIAYGADGLVFEGTAALLGAVVSARVALVARDGRLLLVPAVPFGGLLTVTLFADPRIAVEAVGARPAPGGFALTVRARLR
jgi:hypothetical protein